MNGMAQIFNLDPYEWTSESEHQVGVPGLDKYGDSYRYAQIGASNAVAGQLQLAPARKTNHDNVSVYAAAAVGVKKVTVTLGATAAVANEYAGGKMIINDVDGEGVEYYISSHPAANSDATLELTLVRGLKEALTTSSQVCLMHHDYNGVIVGTDEERTPAGIPVVDATATYYGWLKTRGNVPALADETLTLGADLTIGTSVAGAVEEADDDTTPLTDAYVGKAIVAGVDTEYRPIKVLID